MASYVAICDQCGSRVETRPRRPRDAELVCRCGGRYVLQPWTPDVFISYASEDVEVATALCETLEQQGVGCWIAPRDILPGADYATTLLDAIERAQILVLILTQNANVSVHVRREVERAVSKHKPVIPFRIEKTTPSKPLEYFISTAHWFDCSAPPAPSEMTAFGHILKALLATKEHRLSSFDTKQVARRLKSRAWEEALREGLLSVDIHAEDSYERELLLAVIRHDMAERGFAPDDCSATCVALTELVHCSTQRRIATCASHGLL